ncbi:MAG: hypothetical protein KF849_16650, partial [Rhizobiaceae bacterium]|nr:hypothetical protein [Rhizobiaceae bacterium]
NTRLISHYKTMLSGDIERLFREDVFVDLYSANKKNARALWSGVCCILASSLADQTAANSYMVDDLDTAFLFSKSEVPDEEVTIFFDAYRSLLNMILVPKSHVAAINRLGARDTIDYIQGNGIGNLVEAQVPGVLTIGSGDYLEYYRARNNQIQEFLDVWRLPHADFTFYKI